ncbi:UNVERIFIED_CONTAM: hypothetical protein Sindi_1996100 [Sesamum indicum]
MACRRLKPPATTILGAGSMGATFHLRPVVHGREIASILPADLHRNNENRSPPTTLGLPANCDVHGVPDVDAFVEKVGDEVAEYGVEMGADLELAAYVSDDAGAAWADISEDAGTGRADVSDEVGAAKSYATADVMHDISINVEKISPLPTQVRSFPTGLFVELWTEEGLSTVASGIGKPLYPDAITRAYTRLDFARVCVMLDATRLRNVRSINHPNQLNHRLPVYAPKTGPAEPTTAHDQEITPPPRGVEKQRDGPESPRGGGVRASREEKAIWNVRGLNKRDHQLAVKDIVAEFRLQFLGLLETHVHINNVAAIQFFLLPNLKWLVNYGMVGNRIWIAWDDNIHFLVYIRSLHESMVITVIYGATEVADRRELWGSLETIAMQTIDIPWPIRIRRNLTQTLV